MNAVVFVAQVNAAAPVDQHVFRLRDELSRLCADARLGIGRHEVGNLLGLARVTDIVDAQAGIEVSEIDDVVAVFEIGLMIRVMMVVRTEAAGFFIKVF